ncbi:MAG: N-acetyltransferase [Rhizorhabdus sp.]|nr:N-acetyltransferase [Rhizorhabdus sp.]
MAVTYLIHFAVKPAERDRFLRLLNAVLDAMRAEPMFVDATLHADPQDTHHFLLYESWQDHQNVLDEQLARPYRDEWHAALSDLLERPREVSMWMPLRTDRAAKMIVRAEAPADAHLIRSLTDAAFDGIEHSSQAEGAIVDALRQAGALTISLVAEQDDMIIGHVAFSPVLIDGEDLGWLGLGPVSVSPNFQRRGIGTALIEEGLKLLNHRGARGCVVLGDPNYYRRFGFTSDRTLRYGDVPPEYFQSILLCGDPARGEVTYHQGFDAH